MTMLQYSVRISANGDVSPIPDWDGGEAEAKITVKLSDTEEKRKRKVATHSRVDNRTPEDRQAAIKKFMETFGGCMEGMPPMTLKEIRTERLERKYGIKND